MISEFLYVFALQPTWAQLCIVTVFSCFMGACAMTLALVAGPALRVWWFRIRVQRELWPDGQAESNLDLLARQKRRRRP